MLGVERYPGFDVDVVAWFVFAQQGDHVPDLPLDRHISDQALGGLGVDAGHTAGVGVAVGVPVADVEKEYEVVLASRVDMGGEALSGIGGGCGHCHVELQVRRLRESSSGRNMRGRRRCRLRAGGGSRE